MNKSAYSKVSSPRRRKAEHAAACKSSRSMAVAAVALVGVLAIGGTVAYLTASTGEVENTFTPASVTTEIEESFNGVVKSDVRVENTSDIPVYVRAKVVVTWQNDKGDVLGEEPVELLSADSEGCGYYTTGLPGSDWVQGDDGFWYYTKQLEPNDGDVSSGDVTSALIGSIVQVGTAPKDGYYLAVEILSDAIQADGVSSDGKAPVDSWDNGKVDVTCNVDGTLSVANKAAQNA